MSGEERVARKPFRAVDVLSGRIDQRLEPPKPARARKQISAQLEPEQVRLLGELHARLNATASARIEKSDLVGLGIELLAAILDEETVAEELDPAPEQGGSGRAGFATADDVRTYAHTHVRGTAAPRGRTRAGAELAGGERGGSAIER